MQRLKTRSQFQAVLAGSVVTKTEHFALHRCQLNASTGVLAMSSPASEDVVIANLFPITELWMGAMAPKRWAKRAVTRNAIKRQIYIVSADFSHQLPLAAFVVRLRAVFSRKEFVSASSEQLKQAVRAELADLLCASNAMRKSHTSV